MSAGDRPLDEWVRENTGGLGADIFIDAVGPGAPARITRRHRRPAPRGTHGRHRRYVRAAPAGNVQAHVLPDQRHRLPLVQRRRRPGHGEMAAAGTLDLSVFEHEVYPLRDISKALEAVDRRNGGFTERCDCPRIGREIRDGASDRDFIRNGKSSVGLDEPIPIELVHIRAWLRPGPDLGHSATPSVPWDGRNVADDGKSLLPDVGETRLIMVTFPPDSRNDVVGLRSRRRRRGYMSRLPGLAEAVRARKSGDAYDRYRSLRHLDGSESP